MGPAAVEAPLREKFASVGIVAGKSFPEIDLTDADKEGMKEAAATVRDEYLINSPL